MKYSFTLWHRSFHLSGLLPLVFLLSFLLPSALHSQSSCSYTINMFDSFGDGWNGGFLTVTSNGVVTTHTLAAGATGTSTFEVTHGGNVNFQYTPGAFIFEPSYEVLDASGNVIFTSGTPPLATGSVFDAVACCSSNCDGPIPAFIQLLPAGITDSTAFVDWLSVPGAAGYLVEYGPDGFPFGTGIVKEVTNSQDTLKGLNPCVAYDVYISTKCNSGDVSCPVGPLSFTTTFDLGPVGPVCIYTLELFNDNGFGWNNANLVVNQAGTEEFFTMFDGEEASFEVSIPSNLLVTIFYIEGFFDDGNHFNILDPDGNVIFSSATPPVAGEVASFVSCSTCQPPTDISMKDVNANNATIQWENYPGASGNYIIEYGPMGFTLGSGITDTISSDFSFFKMTGLEENTWYNVYLRLDCSGDGLSKPQSPLIFKTLWLVDVGVSGVIAPNVGTACNLDGDETVTIELHNFGQLPQTLFEFYFAVNGVPASISTPQDGLFTGVVGNDSTETISFEATWDFSAPGYYLIEAWTVLEGDSNPANDTFRTEIITALPKPLKEDFEDNTVPSTWTQDGIIYPPNAHNNPTFVLGRNLYSGIQSFTVTTQRVGPMETGDTLYFDYRYTDWSAGTNPTILGANDNLSVQISTDCGENFTTVFTINSANHVPSADFKTIAVPLNSFDGEGINVRFLGTWGSGDYWLDLDNINVNGCPASFYLTGNVKPSLEGSPTGGVNLSNVFGEGPLAYIWLNEVGDTVSTEEDLEGASVGFYTVLVTDANGCTDSKSFDLGVTGSSEETVIAPDIKLYPNPTAGLAFLDINLSQAVDFQVRMLNMSGQVIFEKEEINATAIRQELDLGWQPPGMYIVQVVVNGKAYHAKLMVAR